MFSNLLHFHPSSVQKFSSDIFSLCSSFNVIIQHKTSIVLPLHYKCISFFNRPAVNELAWQKCIWRRTKRFIRDSRSPRGWTTSGLLASYGIYLMSVSCSSCKCRPKWKALGFICHSHNVITTSKNCIPFSYVTYLYKYTFFMTETILYIPFHH
jgi:hypothetical protein